jgi:hypothetical protein
VTAAPGRRGRLLVAPLAFVLLTAGNCYDEGDYSPTAANIEAILTLASASGATSLPADGVSRLRLVARLLGNPAGANRTVLFHASGLGQLVGGVADGENMAVEADSTGQAFIDFLAGRSRGTALVTATPKSAPGVTVSLALTLLPADPDSILRFVQAPGRAPADGATLTTFTVEVSPELPAGTMVGFAASASGFGPGGATPLDAPIDDGNRASADLLSPSTLTPIRVSATVGGVTRTAQITFDRALPDAITVLADQLQAPAANDTQLMITATLLRDVGTVTDGTIATFRAQDDAGNPVGQFGNVEASTAGEAKATFLPRTDQPGFVTVIVGVEGSSTTGSVRIELTAP